MVAGNLHKPPLHTLALAQHSKLELAAQQVVERIGLEQLELVGHIALALGKQPMGEHIAQLGPRKLALGKLVVILELDKLVAVELVLDKLVVGPIAALVLGTLVVALELDKQLVVALVLSKEPVVELELKQLGVVA
jgi:hypothetical protein